MAPVIAIWFVPNNVAYGRANQKVQKVDNESKSTYFNNPFFPTTGYVSF